MPGFSPETVFYYTKMKPNEIYSAADQYLSSPDKSFEHPRASRPETHYDNYYNHPPQIKDDLYSTRQSISTDAQVQYYQNREPSQTFNHQQAPVLESVKNSAQGIFYQQTSATEIFASNEQENLSTSSNVPIFDSIAKPAEEFFYQQAPVFDLNTKSAEEKFYQQAPVLEPLVKSVVENFTQEVSTFESIQTPADEAAKIMSFSSSSPPRISNKKNFLPSVELKEKDYNVKLGEIITPGNFFLIFEDNNNDYQDLKLRMKEFYEDHSFFLSISNELLYAAKLGSTKEWGRVQIISSIDKFFLCFFVDDGLTAYVNEEKLFLLDDRFKQLPPRSIRAALLELSGTKWSQASVNYFKSLPANTYTAFIQDVVNDVAHCILANDMVNINEEMAKLVAAEAASSN